MLFVTIILDGVGVGRAPDAEAYGDAGADTLGHVCAAARPQLPHLTRWGLGCIAPLEGVPPVEAPAAAWGTLTETAAGKDSTTGHWEFAGLPVEQPFPTYPDGFPDEVIDLFCREAGVDGVLGNRPASGTEVIATLGEDHMATGRPIVYTSGDSVFQIAAHTGVVPLDTLYAWCQVARDRVCVGPHAVGRVIARPFEGEPGHFVRVSSARKDLSLRPPAPTLQEQLQAAGVRTVAVGKIGPLFDGVGFTVQTKTKGNADGIEQTLAAIREAAESGEPTFIWTNLVDFDELYGHRNDPDGFARALEAFDAAVPALEAVLPEGARLLVSADHGNDPCYPGTDHTREQVPLLVYGTPPRPLGDRLTFADHAATVASFFGLAWEGAGASFE